MPTHTTRFSLYSPASLLLVSALLYAQEPAPAPAKPTSEMRRAVEWRRFDYTCEAGEKLTVYLREQSVKIRFKDQNYFMKQVRSADGEKYSDGKVLWWSVGNGGFLQVDTPDGDGAMLAKDCKLDKPLNSVAATNTVTGKVSYLVRLALPSTAVIEVRLLDVSLADAPFKVLAEEKITLGERQVPVPFTLTFDPTKIEQNHSYSVSARILVNAELRFINDAAYNVLTRGYSNRAELVLKPVTVSVPSKP